MEAELSKLSEDFQKDLEKVTSADEVELLRIKYLGRKALINELFSKMATLPREQKGLWGKNLNLLKNKIASSLQEKLDSFGQKEEKIDLTFPAKSISKGSKHILAQVNEEICNIFKELGFAIMEGKEVEDEWHNFTALNFPSDHPSRDAFDTFYLDLNEAGKIYNKHEGGKHLLRCHTSPSQIRAMKNGKPPMSVISPGRVYRPDEVDATHSFMFHQIEGFAIDTDINFAHLKGVLLYFARQFFSESVQLRFRPHFFPFTEPSAEVDISCIICGGKKNAAKKCSVCKDKGWLEILGCGMIHPQVLNFCGIDSKKYRGFAFGMGVERIAMLKYRIDDIRLFTENDVRFLEQFNEI